MPLSARIDGEPIFAFDLDEEAAKVLSARIKRGEVSLTMACGRPAFPRRSRRGVRHFVHQSLKDSCDWPHGSMTEEHMIAQQTIITAARTAGWEAHDEVAGLGWRADVIASKGAYRVAFEVQWSRQPHYRYDERQQAYERDGVRAAWFARPQGRNDDGLFIPRREVPIFRLSETQPFTVAVGGRPEIPLAEAVTGLLTGRWQFKETSPAVRASRVVAVIVRCYHCNEWMTVHGVESTSVAPTCEDAGTSSLGFDDPLSFGLPNEAEARTQRHPQLLAAIRAAKLPPLAPVKVRNTRLNSTFTTHMYGCPRCPRANASPEITKLIRQFRFDPRAEAILTAEVTIDLPHWCSRRDHS